MKNEKGLELLNSGVLKQGAKVKMSGIRGFNNFTKIEDAYVRKARRGEIEDDWVVVVIDGKVYDISWVDEVI